MAEQKNEPTLKVVLPSSIKAGTWEFMRGDFYNFALKFIEENYPFGLAFVVGEWWQGRIEQTWAPLTELELRRRILSWGATQWVRDKNSTQAYAMGENVAANVFYALEALCAHTPISTCPGVALIDGSMDPDTRVVSDFQLSQFVTRTLPFTSSQVDARPPEKWLHFLAQGYKQGDIDIIQEWAGYQLEDGNRLQKVLWLYGASGSGKSIVAKVLLELVGGLKAVAVRKADDFSSEFSGDLVGKKVIYFQDYRHNGAKDHAAINFVLTVSGDDPIKIRRLYKEAYVARIPGKILYTSNEMPNFKDVSSAMLRRIMVAERAAWDGPVNPGLEQEILEELPQILAWAMEGLVRLRKRGTFDSTYLDKRLMDRVARQTNSVYAWVKDNLEPGGDAKYAKKTDLYANWIVYASANGHHSPHTTESLMSPLFQAAKSLGWKIKSDKSDRFVVGLSVRQGAGDGPVF